MIRLTNNKYINKLIKMHFLYVFILQFLYNSTCFERSHCSSSGVFFVVYCIHSSVQSRANVSSCLGFLVAPENLSSWECRLIDKCYILCQLLSWYSKQSVKCMRGSGRVSYDTFVIICVTFGTMRGSSSRSCSVL